MSPLPLRLALVPLLPSRIPKVARRFEYGYTLRLPDGPEIDRNDPLLTAFGAKVVLVVIGEGHGEAVQSEAFDPGHTVRLIPEPFDPRGPEAIGVWDENGVRKGGTLPEKTAAVVSAGIEAGLEQTEPLAPVVARGAVL